MGRNNCGKMEKENADYQHFLFFFHNFFGKPVSARVVQKSYLSSIESEIPVCGFLGRCCNTGNLTTQTELYKTTIRGY